MIASDGKKVPKIAIDGHLYRSQSTGDTTYWTGLIDALAQFSDQTEFYLIVRKGFEAESYPKGMRVVSIPARSRRWWNTVSFPRVVRKIQADVVHTQYNLSPLLGAKRMVTTIHDVSFFIGPEWFRNRDRLILQKLIPRTCRHADAIITVSETSKSEIELYIPAARGKVSAIYNGPNPLISPVPDEEAKNIVQGLGIVGDYALSVSTRWPRKNMGLAVEAVAPLFVEQGLELVLTGKKGWGEIPDDPCVHYTGFVDHRTLSALYSQASVYLCPSLHEGFGLPILEAWTCGCPVIASAGGALPEVADKAAKIVRSFEPEEWTAAIRELLADSGKVNQYRERGAERLNEFSWSHAAAETMKVYLSPNHD